MIFRYQVTFPHALTYAENGKELDKLVATLLSRSVDVTPDSFTIRVQPVEISRPILTPLQTDPMIGYNNPEVVTPSHRAK